MKPASSLGVETSTLLPIKAVDRIGSLDILRGLALLGMFIVHFHVRTLESDGVHELIRTLVWRLVETKSHGTFALLFGVGFAIQLKRAEDRGDTFATLYLRRLAVLALFGIAAHAFFGFNVLLGYAVWGVALLVVRKWSTRTLLLTVLLSVLSVAIFRLVSDSLLQFRVGPDGLARAIRAERTAAVAVNEALTAADAQSSYLVLLRARVRHMTWFYVQPFFVMPGVTLALFIAGFLLVRHRVFEDPAAHRRLLYGMVAFGVISWLADNWLLPAFGLYSMGLLRDQWLTFSYVAGALLLLSRFPALIPELNPVAAAGRMALTNYLLQIAALDLLFSGYALGLQRVRPAIGLAAAIVCFAAECALSTVWLKHFRLGPAEWLWRSITYGQQQPMRRASLVV
jgi:uncharacterized protein